jgi:hypothetical protein
MGAFMGKGEFIGPKGGKMKRDKVEAKTEMLLQKRKNGILSESEFLVELSKLIPSKEKEKKL